MPHAMSNSTAMMVMVHGSALVSVLVEYMERCRGGLFGRTESALFNIIIGALLNSKVSLVGV